MSNSKLRLSLSWALIATSISGLAQGPEIVDQTNKSTGSISLIWGTNEKWMAASDSMDGGVRIYDLASGRLSREIATSNGSRGFSQAFAVPSADRLVVSGSTALSASSIEVYDVISGTKVFTAVDSEGCLINGVDQAQIRARCMQATGKLLHPYNTSVRTWDVRKGTLLSQETSSTSAYGYPAVHDGTWVAELKTAGVGKQLLSAMKRGAPTAETAYSMYEFTITDSSNKQTVMTGHGMLTAMSQQGQSAVIMTGEGVFLIQVPSGNRLLKLGAGPMNPMDGFSSAKTVLGGSQYFLSGGSKAELVDATTGDVKAKVDDISMGGAGTVSPSGTRLAYSQTGSLVIVNIPDTTQKQIIGNQLAEATAAPDLSKIYEAARIANDPKALQKQMKEQGKEMAEEEKSFEKTLPRFNTGRRAQMEEDHQRKLERQEEARNSQQVDSPAMKAYAAEIYKSYMKFGAPAVMPPEADFLDSGRVLAVLAADLSWNTWDVATGNRLPFRTVTIDYTKLADLASGMDTDKTGAMYKYLRQKLDQAVPEQKSPTKKSAPPTALNDVACSSETGDYLIDLKVELDPKKWQKGKHRIDSAVLRSADGSAIDLLGKNIDFSALADTANLETMRALKRSFCSLSADAKYLVIEQLQPDAAKQKHLSLRERALEGIDGKKTSDSLVLYEVRSGKQVCELEGSRNVDALAGDILFSPSGQYLVAGKAREDRLHPQDRLLHSVRTWETKSCKKIFESAGHAGSVAGFSKGEKYIYEEAERRQIGVPKTYGLHVLDARTGQTVLNLPDASSDAHLINITQNGQIFFGADRDNALGFWDFKTGERLASMRALQEGEWLITTPAGYFDGSPRGWTQIAWRMPGQGLATQPAEIFFNEFYRPGLLSELLQGHMPNAPRNIQQVDRRQPTVRIATGETKVSGRTVKLSVSVEEAPPDAERKEPSGVRDVRLFRNGTLVKVWHGTVKLQSGKASFETTVPVAEGENQFVAYAFNQDNVKSADAAVKIESTFGKRPGTAYVLTVGVNRYANSEFDLKFAVPDALTLGDRFAESQTQVGAYPNVVQVRLLNSDATKANILLALSLLSGAQEGNLPASAPKQLLRLKSLQPEDAVTVYFAGHGLAWSDRFYLIPHDLGYKGDRSDLEASIQTVLTSSISDQELENAFEPMQAGHLLLIIDACNSGKALDSEEQRRGPMNSRGLAQLAYEKGMYVLTAAQGYQAALESSRLGHGYLTYALAEEGLKTGLADTQPADGKITAAEWFEYASRRVPELQMEAIEQASEGGRQLTFEAGPTNAVSQRGMLQTPRFYYRRELSGSETVVAVH